MELIRKQTYITAEQDRQLKQLAREEGTTQTDLLRRALDRWLLDHAPNKRSDLFERMIGFVDGPEGIHHDDIYG
jgi:hypothetical protein